MVFGFLGPIGWNELVIILVIVLLIFGPRRLPDFADALGKSIRKFRQATQEAKDGIEGASGESKPPEKKKD
ncbi:MAG TPA: twin-arginine translocase TatA/TatE family subunit [Candidatus Krumholzibacteria bacterium]|nr:twin-arginine translocase TatA/TatE family subunit [Candidatus Krumholzibacteria bacterium]